MRQARRTIWLSQAAPEPVKMARWAHPFFSSGGGPPGPPLSKRRLFQLSPARSESPESKSTLAEALDGGQRFGQAGRRGGELFVADTDLHSHTHTVSPSEWESLTSCLSLVGLCVRRDLHWSGHDPFFVTYLFGAILRLFVIHLPARVGKTELDSAGNGTLN